MAASSRVFTAAMGLSILFGSPFSIAADSSEIVNVSYQGEITATGSSGGVLPLEMRDLVGNVFRVDFSYYVNAPLLISLSPDSTSALYGHGFMDLPLLKDMTITAGDLSWNWDSVNGSADIYIEDNRPGGDSLPSDAFDLNAQTFVGPEIFDGPVEFSYFSLIMRDKAPADDPDGISAIFPLPTTSPNPALFSGGILPNRLSFTLITTERTEYLIETQSVVAAPIPEPTTFGLLATGLFALVCGVRRVGTSR